MYGGGGTAGDGVDWTIAGGRGGGDVPAGTGSGEGGKIRSCAGTSPAPISRQAMANDFLNRMGIILLDRPTARDP
jgi:hypothetical protein